MLRHPIKLRFNGVFVLEKNHIFHLIYKRKRYKTMIETKTQNTHKTEVLKSINRIIDDAKKSGTSNENYIIELSEFLIKYSKMD
jgi:uncharacterized protein (UPF0305 family)